MNTIVQHIADFLKEYAPFDQLTFQELSDIATSIRVVNLEKQNVIQFNDVLHDSFML
jgi:CBS domain-containing protein